MSPGRRLARAVADAIRTGRPPPAAATPPDTPGDGGDGLASSGTLATMPKSRKRKRVADKQRAQRARQHSYADGTASRRPSLTPVIREDYVDHAARDALRRRGWRPLGEDVGQHLWQWPPSCDPRDERHEGQFATWQEGTVVFPAGYGRLTVQLAHIETETDSSFSELHYGSLEELLAAIDVIERYRPGDPVPPAP